MTPPTTTIKRAVRLPAGTGRGPGNRTLRLGNRHRKPPSRAGPPRAGRPDQRCCSAGLLPGAPVPVGLASAAGASGWLQRRMRAVTPRAAARRRRGAAPECRGTRPRCGGSAAAFLRWRSRQAGDHRKVHRPGTPPVLCSVWSMVTIQWASTMAGQFQARTLAARVPVRELFTKHGPAAVDARADSPSLMSKAAETSS